MKNMLKKKYKLFNLVIFFLGISTILTINGCKKKSLPPPNILWIVSEDNSPFLGCYGDSVVQTPNLDKLAESGIRYTNAYANAPVCAPARSTLITGIYPVALCTENMRSTYKVPDFVRFYPHYLKEAGYYTSNNYKKDYNTIDQPDAWDDSGKEASYKNRKPGQAFFHIFNLTTSHESSLHRGKTPDKTNPNDIKLPPYHPDLKEVRDDWAVYYDRLNKMDEQVGKILTDLEEEGLKDNTIVFYYSDHGGVLARSKRFLFQSGLQVPLIVHIPEVYKHLKKYKNGSSVNTPVSFIDLAPTLLHIAGLEIPDYYQGKPFLGNGVRADNKYAFAFRGRMDERFDLSRGITDGKYRYTRNYMPHRPYGQHISYLWKAPSMEAIEKAYLKGELNEVQSRFFKTKPFEELYDIKIDPHNINNLAENKEYQKVKNTLRKELDNWQLQNHDGGFIPEAMLEEINLSGSPYEYTHSDKYPIEEIMELAERAASGNPENLEILELALKHQHPVMRYWATVGLLNLGELATPAKKAVQKALSDSSYAVRITAAECLYYLGEEDLVVKTLLPTLSHENLMVRMMALNAIDYMENLTEKFLPEIEKVIRDKKDRSYDNRLMWRIVYKMDI